MAEYRTQTIIFPDGETWTTHHWPLQTGTVPLHLVQAISPNSDGVDFAETGETTPWDPPPEMSGDGWNGVY